MMLAGHEQPWTEWRAALAGPRLPHGWILSGRRGLGKSAFALEAAQELVAAPDTAQHLGYHPDVIVLTHLAKDSAEERKRDEGKPFEVKRNITVDQIRELQQRLHTRPTLGSRRAVVIDPADALEKGAANALLKSLEEPPVGTFFLLVAHRLGRLLPTIRSRCRILAFPRVGDAEIEEILVRETPRADAAARSAAIAAANGSPGAALEFLQFDFGEIHRLMGEIADNGDPGFARRGKLAEAIGARPDRKRQLAAIELARAVVAGRMGHTARAGIPALSDTHAELVRLAAQAPTYNFDSGLLMMEIGTLLASLAAPSERLHG